MGLKEGTPIPIPPAASPHANEGRREAASVPNPLPTPSRPFFNGRELELGGGWQQVGDKSDRAGTTAWGCGGRKQK